jgi:hypothetical protein
MKSFMILIVIITTVSCYAESVRHCRTEHGPRFQHNEVAVDQTCPIEYPIDQGIW